MDINITDKAKQKAKQLMSESNLDKSYFIRVSVKGGGCSGLKYDLDFDNELSDDDFIIEKEIKIVCDKKSFFYLTGTTLDYSGGLNGKGFVFNNPQASRTCGCGESFSI